MSELIVVGFEDEFEADRVLNELLRAQKAHLVDLEDAAVVVKTTDGKVRLKQTQDLTMAGVASGGTWGLLVGMLFLNPLAGLAVGMAAGAVSGALTDIGIDDDFMKETGETLAPGTSALFILVRKITPDRVIEELGPFKGRVLRTSLSREQETQLVALVEKARAQANEAAAG